MRSRKGTARLRSRVAIMAALALFVLVFLLFDQLVALAPGGRRKDIPPVEVAEAIGATLEPLDRGTARTLHVGPEAGGLVVTSVSSSGPASKAGIIPGDVVERINRIRIRSLKEAADAIGQGGPEVTLTLHRDHHYATVQVKSGQPARASGQNEEDER